MHTCRELQIKSLRHQTALLRVCEVEADDNDLLNACCPCVRHNLSLYPGKCWIGKVAVGIDESELQRG